ncbi:roadblock/LC7 domain-containing protein [Streptomyces sp. NBC_01185]|uniref:roadblock/LC7 domain-containing protein n=1 Tax=Streptomyces sp. NBC_01185 TaxID=2903764 RepID=UPI003868F3F9|nr:roadblock/LC7 domain-containing protein [Streptomyces sp. NBC_01185]
MTVVPKRPLLRDMSWVLTPLLEVPGVVHALVLSGDGMIQGATQSLTREAGEGASAMASAVQGACKELVRKLAGQEESPLLHQVVVSTNYGFAFLIPAGDNTVMAVYAQPTVDMGVIAHAMQVQVSKLGDKVMNSPARDRG